MNSVDRQRIIHGLQADIRALERVIALLRELEQDQLDLLPGVSQQLAGSGGGNEPPVLCGDCNEPHPFHLSWCPWEGVHDEDRDVVVQPPRASFQARSADLEERGTSSSPPSVAGGSKGGSLFNRKVAK